MKRNESGSLPEIKIRWQFIAYHQKDILIASNPQKKLRPIRPNLVSSQFINTSGMRELQSQNLESTT